MAGRNDDVLVAGLNSGIAISPRREKRGGQAADDEVIIVIGSIKALIVP
jgi:hypothetical protein